MLTFIVFYSQLSTRGATGSETFALAFNVLFMECGGSAVECRTRNRDSPGSNPPFVTVWKFGHFRSLHDGSLL